jgi:hypothetical protein
MHELTPSTQDAAASSRDRQLQILQHRAVDMLIAF